MSITPKGTHYFSFTVLRLPCIKKDPPFVMYKKNHLNLTGNDRFEGFLVDLFDRIAKNLKFEYEFYESPDGNYGSKDSQGNWNGMIRELIIGVRFQCFKKYLVGSIQGVRWVLKQYLEGSIQGQGVRWVLKQYLVGCIHGQGIRWVLKQYLVGSIEGLR